MELRGGANREQAFAVASSGAACAADAAEDLVACGGAARSAEEVLALRLCALTGEFYRANAESFSQTRQSSWQGWVRLLEVMGLAGEKKPLGVLDLAPCLTGCCRVMRWTIALRWWKPGNETNPTRCPE